VVSPCGSDGSSAGCVCSFPSECTFFTRTSKNSPGNMLTNKTLILAESFYLLILFKTLTFKD
jgi:hypothetical protein